MCGDLSLSVLHFDSRVIDIDMLVCMAALHASPSVLLAAVFNAAA